MAAAAGKGLCQLFLGMTKTVDQLTIGQSLFDRVQVFALDILDNRNFQHFNIVKFPDHNGNFMQSSDLRGAPAAFACNNFVLPVCPDRPNDQRLHDAFLANRLGQLV